MKKDLLRAVILVLVSAIVLLVILNLKVQWDITHQKFQVASEAMFEQVENLVESNAADLKEVRAQFSEDCLTRARIAAYVIQDRPELENDVTQLRALAKLLDVDELHLFTPAGEIYSGTHPEYFHYTFFSGEQMSFFQPMLEDRALEMCQEITPNTAEGKLMQYAAVWSSVGDKIVQIGMEPVRVQEIMEGRTLETIFSSMPTEISSDLFAIDPNSGLVVASTSVYPAGERMSDMEINPDQLTGAVTLSHTTIDGVRYCVAMCRTDDYILMRTTLSSELYEQIALNTIFLILNILLITLVAVAAVLLFIDRRVVRCLAGINRDLQKIGKGQLDQMHAKFAAPELEELCGYINDMLLTLRATGLKTSLALEHSKLPIGIFEYPTGFHQGFATSRVREILLMEDECHNQEQSLTQIAERISQLKENGQLEEDDVYKLTSPDGFRFVRLDELRYQNCHLVILVDVTAGWRQQEELREQRDRDEMTELYNRRGFYAEMELLMRHPDRLGLGAMVMLDADGLKAINDNYGHAQGDVYLKKIAQILKAIPDEHILSSRLGGDEFAAFLHGYTSKDELNMALQKLSVQNGCHVIRIAHCEQELRVQFSIGWARYPSDSEDYHALLHLADRRMYEHKRQRKEEMLSLP